MSLFATSRDPKDDLEEALIKQCWESKLSFQVASLNLPRENAAPGFRTADLLPVYHLSVYQSGAGYYIGTIDPEEGGAPISRDSVEYYRHEVLAREALRLGTFTFRLDP